MSGKGSKQGKGKKGGKSGKGKGGQGRRESVTVPANAPDDAEGNAEAEDQPARAAEAAALDSTGAGKLSIRCEHTSPKHGQGCFVCCKIGSSCIASSHASSRENLLLKLWWDKRCWRLQH